MKHKNSKTTIWIMVIIIVAAGAFLAGQMLDFDFPWNKPTESSRSEMSKPVSEASEIESSDESQQEISESGETSETGEETSSSSQSSEISSEYVYVAKTDFDIKRGRLILVNRDLEYQFDDSDENTLVSVYQYKNKSYKVKNSTLSVKREVVEAMNDMFSDFKAKTGKNDINIISGRRTFENQETLYNKRVASEGLEETNKYTALPGHSEHHTGYAVDLAIYTSDGLYYDFYGQDEYNWVNQNCYKYGFIERYQEAKKDQTGFSAEPWHFRYVGVAHAKAMYDEDMCHEEYMAMLRTHKFEGEHYFVTTGDGSEYEIYYVEGKNVPVPKDGEYEVSGDNDKGFVVTVKVK